ncbi:energy-coupling factor transporter transmembrane protein EcfT [Corallococcus sp. CAG:1435]|uniref:Energy-coupling factor transporter transmembrane protein EcfT n=1 Tax=Candidatus Fimimonas gallinarum TaxID=2840821 RepID=A0A9D1E2Z9_9BACT|nr:energy-coupling factor transporter transmembrane protein EcfT [Corallococcus sp. CAG:1435]HIR65425.1 energy-coupling factor transporter transmembrane protein EcfT [Candidatus Fimimonas gallinarum]
MLRDVTFGQYYLADSFLHKMDARVKLVLCLVFMVGIFFVVSFVGFAWLTLFLLLAIAFSKVPLKSILKSIKGIIILLALTVLLNVFFTKTGNLLWEWWIFQIYDEGLKFAAKMLLRLTYLVMGSSLLTLTTTPVDLTHAIESLMKPLRVVRFPVHELALIMSLTLSFIPSLIEETDRIIRAQKARGANFDTGNLVKRAKAFVPILIPLLVGGFRRAEELANAMNSRCYEGATVRTQMRVMKVSWRDFVGAIVVVLFFTAVFVVYGMQNSWSNITWLYF